MPCINRMWTLILSKFLCRHSNIPTLEINNQKTCKSQIQSRSSQARNSFVCENKQPNVSLIFWQKNSLIIHRAMKI